MQFLVVLAWSTELRSKPCLAFSVDKKVNGRLFTPYTAVCEDMRFVFPIDITICFIENKSIRSGDLKWEIKTYSPNMSAL